MSKTGQLVLGGNWYSSNVLESWSKSGNSRAAHGMLEMTDDP